MQAGRNEPCPCGSGQKHKKCCLSGGERETGDLLWRQMGSVDRELGDKLMEHAARFFGPSAVYEAWDEFWGWSEGAEKKPFARDAIENQMFVPFFLCNWLPDLETRTYAVAPRDKTIGLNFLEKRGGYLSALERRYLNACLDIPFSFHDVMEVNPGQGFRLRDIFLGTEVEVTERSGSRNAKVGDILFAKIIQIDHVATAVGSGWVMIPPVRKNAILELRKKLRESPSALSGDTLTADALHDFDIELRDLFLELQECLLAPPVLSNTDGEVLSLHQITYGIDSPQRAFDALKGLAFFESEQELLDHAEYDDQGKLKKVLITWHKAGNAMHKEWENTVMGRLQIDGEELKIHVNSANRAALAREEVEKRLGSHAIHRSTVLQSVESLARERDEGGSRDDTPGGMNEQDELMKIPEVQAQMQAMMEKHWENWYDLEIPALGDRTPREAAKDSDGREMLEALILEFRRTAPKTNIPYQPNWDQMRERLGLTTRQHAGPGQNSASMKA